MQDDFNPFIHGGLLAQDWEKLDWAMDLSDDTRLLRFAEAIEATHRDQRDDTARWRSIDNRLLGLKGERAFARVFGIKMDMKLKKYGNQRVNFVLSNGGRVDVVTRSMKHGMYPDLTIRHKASCRSKMLLYLIVWAGDDREPYHAGWITEQEAHRVGRVDQFKEGITNTVVEVGQLNDPRKLLEMHAPHSRWLKIPEPVVKHYDTPLPPISAIQKGLFDGHTRRY